MPAKYVLAHKDTGYHWNLLATNGRVIASSEQYNTKAAAMTGIRSVQKNGATEVIISAEELEAARKQTKVAAKRAGARGSTTTTTAAGAAKATKAAASQARKKDTSKS